MITPGQAGIEYERFVEIALLAVQLGEMLKQSRRVFLCLAEFDRSLQLDEAYWQILRG
jgi:hypothetical protein